MKRLFALSPRLQAIADLVPSGTRLADIGTDHGRLPVWLIRQGIITGAVASDLRPGPLGKAQALARRWEVADRLSFRLCDGLAKIAPDEAQTVVIAGMGGETIADILERTFWSRDSGHRYILQPMSGQDGLRRYLSAHGFAIRREVLVEEGEALYVILLAQPGEMAPLTEGEIWVGRQERGMESPLRGRYLAQEVKKLHRAVEGLERSEAPGDGPKLAQYRLAAEQAEALKEEWEQWQR